METFGFQQHVHSPTHTRGHILDLIFTRGDDVDLLSLMVIDPLLGDHSAVHFSLSFSLKKSGSTQKVIKYRNFKKIEPTEISKSVLSSKLCSDETDNYSCDKLLQIYNSELKTIIDDHAPEVNHRISYKPHCPWFDGSIADARRVRGKAEKRNTKTKLEIDKQMFKGECRKVTDLVKSRKKDYYKQKVPNCGTNYKTKIRQFSSHSYLNRRPGEPIHQLLQ
ncbi:hypothetical protein SNE40_002936 [Patella caerulea]|uniref:Uncharacterized protein n=1 Tax=Patella caerulea TaxID=87958 RepID=A0AAN8K1Z6_PATCE